MFGLFKPKAAPSQAGSGPASGDAEHVLRHLEWTVIRRLDGLLQGDYRTLLRGAGIDLADLREYQHHDDVRHIDWNVTARLQIPHVRVFTEDREMAAWFLLDLSPSVDFGSGEQRKHHVSAGFVAVLARLLTRHGNRVGALLYGAGVDTVIPAGSGRRHVLQLMHAMQQRPRHAEVGTTRLHELLQSAAGIVRRRSTIFVVSDFISEAGWEKPLGLLAQRHEVVAVRLMDPLELDLPDLGLITMRDAESGEQLLVDTHDPKFRQRFSQIAAQREAQLRQTLARAGVDTLELSTSDDLVQAILRFTDLRKRRSRLVTGAKLPSHLEVVA
ncbi:MAG: DUF58 domain-containing protein [Rhodoferax sp.]|nr:DUF58 domain-containing protein [Rhodoferax sp.]